MANAVELRNLEKSFKTAGGVIHAVQGLSLTIPAGQRVALIGPNGAGKSTTIDMLLGLTRPDRGEVRIDGEGPRAAVRNGRIGAMLQNGGLIGDLTVRELLSMIACLFPHSMSVEAAMEIAHVSQHARKRATRLSGGEAQRVRFAIALVSSPSLIVLDEPTAAMDVQGREDFWATMTTLENRGMTALFASHYLAEADMYADRVVVIVAGKIVADGPSMPWWTLARSHALPEWAGCSPRVLLMEDCNLTAPTRIWLFGSCCEWRQRREASRLRSADWRKHSWRSPPEIVRKHRVL